MLICDLCERPAINTIYLTISYLEPKETAHEYHRCEEHQLIKMPVMVDGEPAGYSLRWIGKKKEWTPFSTVLESNRDYPASPQTDTPNT